jgi:acylphosphatase
MGRKKAKRWIVKGNVQGVGFRVFAQHRASHLGLSGWVRNLDDGSVEAYAVGPEANLSDFAAFLHTGPRAAEVRSVEEREEAIQNLSGFSVR